MGIEVRAARLNDYPAISRLLLQIAQLHHEWRPDVFRPASQKYNSKQYKTMLKDKDAPILVAENAQGQVLGYAMCKIFSTQNPVMVERGYLYLDDLCVDEKARGQGVGELLMQAVTALAKERGLDKIELNAWECNEGARKFYEKLGYVTQKRGLEIWVK